MPGSASPRAFRFDAIVLAGGRSSRLGSVPKAGLLAEGSTLLERTLAALVRARRTVVVGPPTPGLPSGVLVAREEPPFSGPAAAIAAGLSALDDAHGATAGATLVLACDMPHVGLAIPRLLRGLVDNPDQDGVIAVEDGRLQPLASGFRTARLSAAVAARTASIQGMAVLRLLDGLHLVPVEVPPGATADVDTWDDARRLGVSRADPAKENA